MNILVAAPSVVAEELGDDLCLYLPGSDDVITLNHTAADVWRLVDGQTSSADLTATLATAYRVESAAIEADVTAVLDTLTQRGFLLRSDAS